MKKVKSILVLGLLVLVMNSCVYSLFPIYTDDTLVYVPKLIGRWEMAKEPGDYIEFRSLTDEKAAQGNSSESKAGNANSNFKQAVNSKNAKSYRVVIVDDGEKLEFVGHLAKIGDDFFLDLYPTEDYAEGAFGANMIPVHTFIKLNYANDQLDLTAFNLEKLNKLFESNLIRLRHENVDGTVLITAQPKEIQKFLDQYSDDKSVFEETERYKQAS